MIVVKTFKAGDTKCLDDGSGEQGLLISGPNGAIIALMFDKARCTHAQIHDLDRIVSKMGLTAVEVQTEGPRYVVQPVPRRIRARPGRWPY
jgi:hypothetical protein